MSNADSLAESYDRAHYPARPFVETHPARVAAVGHLFGVAVAPIENCRVLEIGCACGGNIIPLAEQLPSASFVAVDQSASQIAEARNLADRIDLKNLELHAIDLHAIDARFGQFDYIICHGIFSWIVHAAQVKLLRICSDRLKPQGIAYVSYNTYPGWHSRNILRDMMYFHAGQFREPATRLREARRLLNFVAENTVAPAPHANLLKAEVEALRGKADGYVLHDELETINSPIYFAQFAERAAEAGLQYLAESDLASMWTGHFPPAVVAELENFAANLVQREQYLDFLRNRSFRQTLLCHAEAKIDRQILPERMLRLVIAAPLRAADDAEQRPTDNEAVFQHCVSKRKFTASQPLWIAALSTLADFWPRSLGIEELLAKARQRLGSVPTNDANTQKREALQLAKLLLELNLSGLAELRTAAPSLCSHPDTFPCASRLARVQARVDEYVTNLRHETVQLTTMQRQLLPTIDGRHSRDELNQQFVKLRAGQQLEPNTSEELDEELHTFAKLALLCSSSD